MKMDDLSEHVNSGICSAAGVRRDRSPREFFESFFQFLLNRPALDLTLPAGEIGAVIGKDELKSASFGLKGGDRRLSLRRLTEGEADKRGQERADERHRPTAISSVSPRRRRTKKPYKAAKTIKPKATK